MSNMEEHYIKDVGKITYVYGVNLEEHKTVIEKQQKRIAELEQELAELKEKAIVPKFKLGQKVWYISQNNDNVYEFNIKEKVFTRCKDGREMLVYYDEYCVPMYEYELYSSKEEAQAKLQELRGGE